MYTVLLPVDRNVERALHQGRYVEALPDAAEEVEARVLFVYPEEDYSGAPPHEFDAVDAAVAVAGHLEDVGIPVERVVDGGNVPRTIIEHAREIDADDVVMGGRKRTGVQKVLMGSITLDVVLSLERPVTITG